MNKQNAAPYFGRRGLIFVLSSPSGAGKTTISRELLRLDENLVMSVSTTTRPMRAGETEGADYNFVDEAHFERMTEDGAFLEHAQVFGYHYGTPRAPVEAALQAGTDVLFDIDWQGTQQLATDEKMGADLVSVFILPPSTKELESRLNSRARDPEEVVRERMAKASGEMSHFPEYTYIIVNDDIDQSVDRVQAILDAERLRMSRQVGLHEFVQGLRGVD
ncbi:MAG: guanylate kinase [Rhodospirillaceae bacterium]|nr:guanylate kinase [Rhodospirillaceae bacterium]MBT3883809.1 guanylate kinase [Rhodospirillaceae bacterium]MBT4118842.1 guanylate kinase [Rhodospirillaceae bacterium]MBT4674822.1 guanylate kinase [Rhodospirillaceae bacterium]MBT4720493.1 guanylate kinase [Rhodospirillaceae bacterium]